MTRTSRIIACLACLASVVSVSSVQTVSARAAVSASSETFADYSMMFQSQRRAGQFYSGGAVAGNWTWEPQSATQSYIDWGTNDRENYIQQGNWVMIDGWWGNGTYYTERVTQELICDASGQNCSPLPSSGGLQHYVQWSVPSGSYMLKAWGTITEQSSGKFFDFGHTQIWSGPQTCSNQYLGSQTCIKQWESWWDNNGQPGQPITRKLERDNFLARGIGMAFTVLQYYPSSWRADLRSYWDLPGPGATITLSNELSGRCLDADLNTIGSNGTRVQLWDCNGQPQQKWYIDQYASQSGTIWQVLRNVASGRCLDADLNSIQTNGTYVQLWDCNGQPQQEWRNVIALQNQFSQAGPMLGRCLDADTNTIGGNGTRVQLWDCNAQNQQNWLYAYA